MKAILERHDRLADETEQTVDAMEAQLRDLSASNEDLQEQVRRDVDSAGQLLALRCPLCKVHRL